MVETDDCNLYCEELDDVSDWLPCWVGAWRGLVAPCVRAIAFNVEREHTYTLKVHTAIPGCKYEVNNMPVV